MNLLKSGLWFCLVAAVAGCQTSLRAHKWQGIEHAQQLMVQRGRQLQSISARGRLVLRHAEDRKLSLDAVLLAAPPDRLRLRTWKLGRPVMDLTVRPDGTWIWAMEHVDIKVDAKADQVNGIFSEWPCEFALWLVGVGLHEAVLISGESTDDVLVLRKHHNGGVVTAMDVRVDRPTLTIRRIDLIDWTGRSIYQVRLSCYRVYETIPLPMQIDLFRKQDQASIQLRDVAVNAPLPPNAFCPPTRATKVSRDSSGP